MRKCREARDRYRRERNEGDEALTKSKASNDRLRKECQDRKQTVLDMEWAASNNAVAGQPLTAATAMAAADAERALSAERPAVDGLSSGAKGEDTR